MTLGVSHWLFLGLAYAAGAAVLATAAFALGEWAFPRNPLRRFGGRTASWRRRGTIRAYLDAIGEPYREDSVVEGVHVEFYLPNRDVVVTFDAAVYDALRDAAPYVVFCEDEMPGNLLGERLPFETPDPAGSRGRATAGRERWARGSGRRGSGAGRRGRSGTRTRNDRRRVRAAFSTLGVSSDASPAEVKAAYRETVKDVHPDHGGSEEAFARVQDAYATAKQHVE